MLTDTKVEAIQPVPVTIIGTMADDMPTTGTIATTPRSDQPNLIVRVVTPIAAILVRFGYTFCVSLAGSLMAGGLTAKVMPHTDFIGLIEPSVFLAACIAGVGLIKDSATVFSGLEKKFPLSSGSV